MAENLNVGTMVDGASEQTNNSVIEKYCFSDDSNICVTDGGFYQWNEMMQYSTAGGAQGICPTGWHLPTDSEWKTLEMALGMTQAEADLTGWRGTDQATQLKLGGTSGFQALLAGSRNILGKFSVRETAGFWSSTDTESGSVFSGAWSRGLPYASGNVVRGRPDKALGFSVRCVKD